MKTLNKKSRALSLFVVCLALAGGGAAFDGRLRLTRHAAGATTHGAASGR